MRNSIGRWTWVLPWLGGAMIMGCSGSRAPILGTGGSAALRPTVTAVVPLNGATGVSTGTTVTATFSTPMSPLTGAASFVVTCAAPCVNPTGTVTLDATNTIATFTLTPPTTLQPSTLYTATITAATAISNGLAIAAPTVWQFTTIIPGNVTRPSVTQTVPVTQPSPPNTPGNASIIALFSKDMAPATIIAANFTVTCASPAPCADPTGTVSYDVANKTAIFTPAAALTVGDTYTATITPAATDLAGRALLGNVPPTPSTSPYVWSFIAIAPATAGPVTVAPSSPTTGQIGVCPTAAVNATFTVPAGLRMDPRSVSATTFTLTGPAPASTPVVAASVLLDAATGTIATFTPQGPLTANTTYTATILGGAAGVKDLAVPANELATNNFVWTFTTGAGTAGCLAAPPVLGSAAAYGDFGGTAGMTNTGILTVINGDIGTIATGTSTVTGFHDEAGDIYTETPANIGAVNGTIFTCTNSTTGPNSAGPNAPNCQAATQARLDAQTAYLALAALPPGANPGVNLGTLTLVPGVYTAPSGSFLITGGNLTLNAGGDANAVWVFQMATSLTVGEAAVPRSITLTGGAQAKNVFWQVGSAATINPSGGGTMVGTIISQAGAAFSTVGSTIVTTLNGRALSLGASVTLVDTVINVPAP